MCDLVYLISIIESAPSGVVAICREFGKFEEERLDTWLTVDENSHSSMKEPSSNLNMTKSKAHKIGY